MLELNVEIARVAGVQSYSPDGQGNTKNKMVQAQTQPTADTSWDLGAQADYETPFEYIDPGTYVFELTAKGPDEQMKPEFDPEQKKKRAQFSFTVVEDNNNFEQEVLDSNGNGTGEFVPKSWVGYVHKQFYTVSLHEKSNLYPVIKALMGGKLERDQQIGMEILGRRFIGTITDATNQTTGKTYRTLAAPLPYRPRRGQTANVS